MYTYTAFKRCYAFELKIMLRSSLLKQQAATFVLQKIKPADKYLPSSYFPESFKQKTVITKKRILHLRL